MAPLDILDHLLDRADSATSIRSQAQADQHRFIVQFSIKVRLVNGAGVCSEIQASRFNINVLGQPQPWRDVGIVAQIRNNNVNVWIQRLLPEMVF